MANSHDAEAVLREWRTSTLNRFLTLGLALVIPAEIVAVIDAQSHPGEWPGVIAAGIAIIILAILKFSRGLDSRIRAWGLLLLMLAVAIMALAMFGLGGAGRVYLLALPIIALVLVGVRSGLVVTGLAAVIYAGFALAAWQGALATWLVDERNSLQMGDWLAEAADTFLLLTVVMVLLVLFHRFQLQVIDRERRALGELARSQALLEEQNAALEQNVQERTSELTGVVAQLQEQIAEREGMARALAQSEQMYRGVIENSIDVFFRLDGGGNVLLTSPSGPALLGYTSVDEMQGLNITRDLFEDPNDRERFYAAMQKDGAVKDFEARLKCRDGGIIVVIVNARVYFDEQGARVGVEGFLRDFSERKRMEDAIRDSEQRLADIINLMPDAVFVIDRAGEVTTWNRAIEEMTGVSAHEMLGQGEHAYAVPFYGQRRPVLIDLVGLPRQELLRNYAQVRREGEVLIGETYVTSLKGKPAYLQAAASLLRDARGQVTGAIEVIRDLSERKRMEEDLQAAKEAAEAATQAKSAFLATMSHEIRTPMNAIIGMTGLLLDTSLTREQREFAEVIRFSGDALLTIINDILDFSKIEAGRMELEEQPFLLRDCVEGAVDLLAGRANEKKLNLACVIEPGTPPAIFGDVTRLRQILVNLLGNAVKFTESGEVVVTVTSDMETAAPSPPAPASVSLHFAVRDTGIGIAAEGMERLFQSFSQVDASTTRRFGGTGLGLAISKRLSELMGGRMWAESEGVPGQGSTFHFTIQARVAEMGPAANRQGVQPKLQGKRVLIVDDNATNRRILSLQMHSWAMVPCATGSPSEALAWLKRGDEFDVAFLDLHMPQMDGIELSAEIRKLRTQVQLPLVMLSSQARRETNVPEGRFAAFLAKPIKASQIYNVLIELFAGQPEPAAATAPAQPQYDASLGERHPLRILLAEDNRINQKVALLMLGRLGYRADVAANGLEALQSLRRQAYDVVLMDIQMPEMDGLEATRAIWREWPTEGRPRIVAMTANATEEDRAACMAAGMDDYLSKPVLVEELVAALNRCRVNPSLAEASGESLST